MRGVADPSGYFAVARAAALTSSTNRGSRAIDEKLGSMLGTKYPAPGLDGPSNEISNERVIAGALSRASVSPR